MKKHKDRSTWRNVSIIFAIILILLGISLLNPTILFFMLAWQVCILLLGIFLVRKKYFFEGILSILFSIIFLADTLINQSKLTIILLGFGVIVQGIKILIDNLFNKNKTAEDN